MTSSMSAARPTPWVMTVDGVSGEIATPARIPLAWIASINASGFSGAAGSAGRRKRAGRGDRTRSLVVEAVQRATRVCDVVHPLRMRISRTGSAEAATDLLGLGDHHVAVHEDPRHALAHALEDGGAWAKRLNGHARGR